MKNLTIIILTIFPIITWAHQDTYHTYEYDNVTVRFKTGFFFEEINNARIIGQYAALLSDSMNYDKPVLLDFIHDYGYFYRGKTISFLNFGSEKYDLISYLLKDTIEANLYHFIPHSDTVDNIANIKKDVYTVPPVNRHKKIVIRQFGFHFDVTQTMNLLFHAITNRKTIKGLSRTDTLSSYFESMYYRFETVPSDYIDSIKSTTYRFVDRILDEKVYRDVDTTDRHRLYYSYFSKNGKAIVYAELHDEEVILDTLDKVYSINPGHWVRDELFVFESPYQFTKYKLNTWVYPEYKTERSGRQKVPIDPHEYIVKINVEWLRDDIYLIKYNTNLSPVGIFPYLANDDVVIEDFDEYINSYRKEKE